MCVHSTPYSMTVESQKNCDQCTVVSRLVNFYLFARFWTAQEGGEKSHILYFHTTLFIHAGIHMPSLGSLTVLPYNAIFARLCLPRHGDMSTTPN